ncbi:MAG TPA: hypothetical protein VNQ56_13960 [Pseudolabrys sp.]|nr:hypothetical protein [Pseudolabrys sp.]
MPNKHIRITLRRDASFIGSAVLVVMLIGFVALAIAPALIDLLY